jgi:protein-tyrosine-phosphatase/predicted ATP-grasp superfamily ATP-dependent carboligase
MNPPRSASVLVIGDDTRSFLATVRSLGRRGLRVHAAPFRLDAPALRSRYVSKVHLLPYYLDGGNLWLDSLRRLIAQENIGFIVPCEERSLLPLHRHRADLPPGCILAIPDERGMDAFFDKVSTRQLAADQGVRVCPGYEPDAKTCAAEVAAHLTFPLIAKHRKSYAWPDLYVRTGVTILPDEAALQQWLDQHREQCSTMFIEQMFPGVGIGVSVLSHEGHILQAFEHWRVHELDGSSYYRKSAPLDSARLAAVTRMCEVIRYTGIAMFEFKLDPATRDWVLLEVNARPWGSLPLPVAIGVDFPHRLYRLMVHGEATPAVPYRNDICARNLVADIWQLRALLPRLRHQKLTMVASLLAWLGSLGRVLIGREHHDALVLDDLRPGIDDITQFLRERLQALRGTAPLPRNTALAPPARGPQRTASQPLRVLFVCQGNICRSPYAEHKARQLAASSGMALEIASAGMLPRNARVSPATAQAVAARRGVSLQEHRSQHAHAELMQWAQAIVIFDATNRRSVLARYPDLADRLCFLDEFSGREGPVREIRDPDGGSEAVFDEVYTQIDHCLNGLLASFQNRSANA